MEIIILVGSIRSLPPGAKILRPAGTTGRWNRRALAGASDWLHENLVSPPANALFRGFERVWAVASGVSRGPVSHDVIVDRD